MAYDVIIIGAGVGGLSAALKLSLAGKKVLILERQGSPGGFATMFERKGFRFESAIHCVNSLGPDGELRNFLEEFGVTGKIDFIKLEDFSRIIYPEHDFVADFNREHFLKFLNNSFPQEKNNLAQLFRQLDKFYEQFDSFCTSELPMLIKLGIGILKYPDFFKISTLTVNQLLDQYIKDEKLKGILTDIWKFMGLPPSRLSALYYLITFRGYYFEPTAHIKGGFAQLFKAMVERIEETGSTVKFSTTVCAIVTEQGKAVKAVRTDKGEEFHAKVVISNANAMDTLTNLLDNTSLRQKYSEKLALLEKSISAFQVYLGLNVPTFYLGMNNFMLSINTAYNQEDNYHYIVSGDYDNCLLEIVDHSQLDPMLAPKDKSTLTIIAFDVYSHWKDLIGDDYKKKKMEIASKLIKRVERYLPNLTKHIEIMEVATPKTMSRFTSSPEGAIYGFAQTVKQSGINRLDPETEIKGLLLAGAWTRPGGGAHACFMSGIDAAEIALKMLT
ncbi:MAG: NAD(P)/FAD-dependent oxidoreductase [Candidatus Omnitrophota bacterium]|nr:NAD(P)/FAD-dependent oxidoreductase [Candidatus Omnitrophota bacterium]